MATLLCSQCLTDYMDLITQNSMQLLGTMSVGCKYTYRELQKKSDLPETQLCFAILSLIRDGVIHQYRDTDVVYELIPRS